MRTNDFGAVIIAVLVLDPIRIKNDNLRTTDLSNNDQRMSPRTPKIVARLNIRVRRIGHLIRSRTPIRNLRIAWERFPGIARILVETRTIRDEVHERLTLTASMKCRIGTRPLAIVKTSCIEIAVSRDMTRRIVLNVRRFKTGRPPTPNAIIVGIVE